MKRIIAVLCMCILLCAEVALAEDFTSTIYQLPFDVAGKTVAEVKPLVGGIKSVIEDENAQVFVVTDRGYQLPYFRSRIEDDSIIPGMRLTLDRLFTKKDMTVRQRMEYLYTNCDLIYHGVSYTNPERLITAYEYLYLYGDMYQILLRNPDDTDAEATDDWDAYVYFRFAYEYVPVEVPADNQDVIED